MKRAVFILLAATLIVPFAVFGGGKKETSTTTSGQAMSGGSSEYKESPVLEAVQGGVQRALLHLQDIPRNLEDPLCQCISVSGPESDDLENQHVQCALGEIAFSGLRWHDTNTYGFYIYILIRPRMQGQFAIFGALSVVSAGLRPGLRCHTRCGGPALSGGDRNESQEVA